MALCVALLLASREACASASVPDFAALLAAFSAFTAARSALILNFLAFFKLFDSRLCPSESESDDEDELEELEEASDQSLSLPCLPSVKDNRMDDKSLAHTTT